jgi:hypothetical protein
VQSPGEEPKARPTRAEVPEAVRLLRATDWIRLTHALGTAVDVPGALCRLLDEDLAVRADALDHLERFLHNQNTIYPATVPTALYLAAILPDPRTAALGVHRRDDWPRPQRAALIDWLGEIADDVRDDAVAIRRRHGFADYPPIHELRAHRDTISRAVAAFLDDPEPATRDAAVITSVLLTDIAALATRIDELGPRVRRVQAETTSRYHCMREKTAYAPGGRTRHRDSPPRLPSPATCAQRTNGPAGSTTNPPF